MSRGDGIHVHGVDHEYLPLPESPTYDHFPLVRKGYSPPASTSSSIGAAEPSVLQQQCEALITENRHLTTALDHAQAASARLDYTGLGGRARDLLRIAEEQAQE